MLRLQCPAQQVGSFGLSDSQTIPDYSWRLGIHGEGYDSRGSSDAGACRSGLSRGDLSGGELDADAAQSPRPGSNILSYFVFTYFSYIFKLSKP